MLVRLFSGTVYRLLAYQFQACAAADMMLCFKSMPNIRTWEMLRGCDVTRLL